MRPVRARRPVLAAAAVGTLTAAFLLTGPPGAQSAPPPAASLNALRYCTSTCTIKVPSGASLAYELWGAGGGGGSAGRGQIDWTGTSGANGGSGAYVRGVLNDVGENASGTVTVTIRVGVPGAGGTGLTGETGKPGKKGGDTFITINGVTVRAGGGTGGEGGASAEQCGGVWQPVHSGDGGTGLVQPYAPGTPSGTGGGFVIPGLQNGSPVGPVTASPGPHGAGGPPGNSASPDSSCFYDPVRAPGRPGESGQAIVTW